jgi:hypothetical protein
VKHINRPALALLAVVGLGSGCGKTEAPNTPGQPVIAGGNSRIPFKDEYKKMISKDGKMLFKPSDRKLPPGQVP